MAIRHIGLIVLHLDAYVNPFLKWPGGKRWLARRLAPAVASVIGGRYIEPFLGGGALFFRLAPNSAILSDLNSSLINTYEQVRDNPDRLVALLKAMPVTKSFYYRVRARVPNTAIEQASRFLYLNRTGYRGLYRVNGRGRCNVPFGGGERTPNILWERDLVGGASKRLKMNVSLFACDFEYAVNMAGFGDLVYCDPTYISSTAGGNFGRYNSSRFEWSDQVRLSEVCRAATERGAAVIVSNALYPEIRELYRFCDIVEVHRPSPLSWKGVSRASVREGVYLFRNRVSDEIRYRLLNPKAFETDSAGQLCFNLSE